MYGRFILEMFSPPLDDMRRLGHDKIGCVVFELTQVQLTPHLVLGGGTIYFCAEADQLVRCAPVGCNFSKSVSTFTFHTTSGGCFPIPEDVFGTETTGLDFLAVS